MKSRNRSQCNETFLVTAVRSGKKFGFQSAAENLQRWRWPVWLRQTAPDWCSSRWKGAVANGRMPSAWSDQRWCSRRAHSSTCVEVWCTEDLKLGSQVQSRGGSDTPALPAGTKYALASEASVTCVVMAECGPDDKLWRSAMQRHSAFVHELLRKGWQEFQSCNQTEPLGGAVGLLEAVSFKEATESVCRGRTTNARG